MSQHYRIFCQPVRRRLNLESIHRWSAAETLNIILIGLLPAQVKKNFRLDLLRLDKVSGPAIKNQQHATISSNIS